MKPVLNNFNYRLLREQNFQKDTSEIGLKSKIPLLDYFEIKLNKLKFKLRNFNDFFILKNKRNKNQDIKID